MFALFPSDDSPDAPAVPHALVCESAFLCGQTFPLNFSHPACEQIVTIEAFKKEVKDTNCVLENDIREKRSVQSWTE